ncbi:MAG TPA: ATP-binding protein [Casimicrobiaceae bacterium]|nr:ATP-binding protein [Casimicrobiaceae bacterium]
MEQIAVCVNQGRLLQSLREALANPYTVLTELLQNARRASASQVAVDYDARTQTLTVRDDGIGIDDWQTLFTLGESGWDATLVRDEHAFGVGFMKCLYSARRCTVRSRNRIVAFDTQAALRQLPIAVQPAPLSAQTVVTLEGVPLPELERTMSVLACAFPIVVIYNGVALPRPLALDAKPYVASAVGQVHLAGAQDGRAVSSLVLVLQGTVVYGDSRLDRDGNVVHLDPRRFQARLPDHDALVAEAEAVEEVEAVLKAMWRARLEEAKRTLPEEVFVARFFDAAVTWGATDLCVDIPFIPGSLFSRITGYPIQEGSGPVMYLQALPGLIPRDQFASRRLQAVMLPAAQKETFVYWMFARAMELLVLTRAWGVAEEHWLWDYVRPLDVQPAVVEILGERMRATLHGQWVATEVVLCEAYRVRIQDEVAEFSAHAMAWCGVHGDEDLIIVPDGEHGGAAVEQCSSYIDADERWRGEFAAQDRDALSRLMRRLRAHDPTEAMRALIGELRLENYPCLQGRTFSLQVGGERGAHAVRLVT